MINIQRAKLIYRPEDCGARLEIRKPNRAIARAILEVCEGGAVVYLAAHNTIPTWRFSGN